MVRPSIALRRLVVCWATCGVMPICRTAATHAGMSKFLSPPTVKSGRVYWWIHSQVVGYFEIGVVGSFAYPKLLIEPESKKAALGRRRSPFTHSC